MLIEENKLLTIQRHTIRCHLIIKYKLSCILVKYLAMDTSIFDTIISKQNERQVKRNKDLQIPFSAFVFGRLMNNEHYINNWNNQLEYRQVHGNDMFNVQYQPKILNDEQLNDNDETIL